MPRPQRAYGRPGSTVFPAGWDTSHAAVLASQMPDRVSLRAAGGVPTWNPATNRTETTPATPFATSVPARIAAIGADHDVVTNDDLVRVAGYDIFLPLTGDGVDALDVDGSADTLVDVTSSADPMLVGKTLRVTGVVRGSTRLERHLLATLNA
jgi:hypothetical protein